MGARHWARWLLMAATCALLAAPVAAQTYGNYGNGNYGNNGAFDRGYREGIQRGADDARRGRRYELERDNVYRDGDRGYNSRIGNRSDYRNDFRRGYASGYRAGYYNERGDVVQGRRDDRRAGGQRGYQDPAFARGYSDGWEKGLDDGRDRDRFDPLRHGDYRSADQGYQRSYGSKDTYKNNYRQGFRQGYEDGYRGGNRR